MKPVNMKKVVIMRPKHKVDGTVKRVPPLPPEEEIIINSPIETTDLNISGKQKNDTKLDIHESSTLWLSEHDGTLVDGNNKSYIIHRNSPLGYEIYNELGEEDNVNNTDVAEENSSNSNGNEVTVSRNSWEYDETVALITAVEQHYEDLYDQRKRKNFWVVIEEMLSAQKIQRTSEQCKKKWANLIRTYKETKGKKDRSGRGPTRFAYFDMMDGLLGGRSANNNPHSIVVAVLEDNVPNVEDAGTASGPIDQTSKRKRTNAAVEYMRTKKAYYETLIRLRKEKAEFYRKKISLETRKVEALEALVKLKSKN